MKTFMKLAATALLLCSCNYTSGTNVTADQARQFVVGKATVSDVETKLGKPTNTLSNSDGTQTLEYEYDNTHQDAMNYVPIVGAFSNHVEETSNKTTFIFSRTGLLQSYSTGSGNTAMHN